MIFLPDGLPTAGITDPDEIVAVVTEANRSGRGPSPSAWATTSLPPGQARPGEEPHEDLERILTSFYLPPVPSPRRFIPLLWAARKVGSKVRRRSSVEQGVALGTRYGIVTPYTSFLVAEGERPAVPFDLSSSSTKFLGGVPAVRASKAIRALQEAERPTQGKGARVAEGRVFLLGDL